MHPQLTIKEVTTAMPIKFSEEYGLQKTKLIELGVFDVIMDVDTRVFLDPALLELATAPEFHGARPKVEAYFFGIITLLSHMKERGDMYWKRADSLLKFREMTGACFGYTRNGTGGNAIGAVLRAKILDTIKELMDEGENDPALFELLGVFQEKVGCDRISDLVTFILAPEVYSFTDRVITALGINSVVVSYKGRKYHTCMNRYNGKPLLLLPADILSPLPVAECFDDIDFICGENQRVRDEINEYFDLGGRSKIRKADILDYMHRSKTFRQTLISAYKSFPAQTYDFDADPAGEYIWLQAARDYVDKFPLELHGLTPGSIDDVLSITHAICHKFKELIEDNGLQDLLYDSKKKPKHERAAQLLFFGIADSYCTANDIDLSREINGGRGPVDFKLSRGAADKVVVEVKLTSNGQLKHGIETQLPIYMRQEKTHKAIYLIIDNGHPQALENFHKFYRELTIPLKSKIDVIEINGTYTPSASNA